MKDSRSLSHTTWECKYRLVWIPKCRRKALYEQLRQPLGALQRARLKWAQGRGDFESLKSK